MGSEFIALSDDYVLRLLILCFIKFYIIYDDKFYDDRFPTKHHRRVFAIVFMIVVNSKRRKMYIKLDTDFLMTFMQDLSTFMYITN